MTQFETKINDAYAREKRPEDSSSRFKHVTKLRWKEKDTQNYSLKICAMLYTS